jgi:hypothetical protein
VHLTDEKYINNLDKVGYYASPVQFRLGGSMQNSLYAR